MNKKIFIPIWIVKRDHRGLYRVGYRRKDKSYFFLSNNVFYNYSRAKKKANRLNGYML